VFLARAGGIAAYTAPYMGKPVAWVLRAPNGRWTWETVGADRGVDRTRHTTREEAEAAVLLWYRGEMEKATRVVSEMLSGVDTTR
jgi:hypothetical protein